MDTAVTNQSSSGAKPESPAAIPPEVLELLRNSLPQDVRQSMPLSMSQQLHLSRQSGNFTQTFAGESPQAEILPGYHIVKSIGSGGFGEVFLCDAPGGIKKAVKIVYGTLDDERAERELRSLERIKDVRHPFLVGIERVEIVNQQLVIVTELADRSLKDRFDEVRKDDRPGVPRDELLRYMRDAAEALDYLYEKHTLQHLDIKPENLLLVGDHLKVADFGLLKDLAEANVSIVGGVTPMYAPPEVLDGRPNRRSDQYSLAIVYQEMLIGESPFNGRTAGQLAAQHMHSAPSLGPLPTSDRYAVGKALAKSPARRFENCREFVDALIDPPKRVHVPDVKQDSVGNEPQSAEHARALNSSMLRAQPVQTEALDPLTELADKTGPVVLVGVGGLGGRVVSEFRRRMSERFGPETELPAIQLLYLDTERNSISEIARREDGGALTAKEVLAMPLRSAQDYRAHKHVLLPWLSRRWLYNIPRSLETEGIRPLGRLALVDHANAVKTRLSAAIQAAADPHSARESTRATGVAFAEQAPRVFIVGSTMGATGSAMLADLGYLAQQCLEDRKVTGRVTGFALHGTGRRSDLRDLAEVNTVATFAELDHFGRENERYPGDEVFRSAPTGRAPFDATYALHLGDDLTDEEFQTKAGQVADYVSRRSLGMTSGFFDLIDQCAVDDESTVRGFGLSVLGGQQATSLPSPNALCDAILSKWAETCRTAAVYGADAADLTESDAFDETARRTLSSLDLNTDESSELTVELESRVDRCKGLIAEAWSIVTAERGLTRADATLESIEKSLSADLSELGLCADLIAYMGRRAVSKREARLKTIREAIFTPPVDGVPAIEDTLGMMFALVRELVDAQQACDGRAKQRRAELDALRRERPPEGGKRSATVPIEVRDYLAEYCRKRLSEEIERARASELQALIAETVGTSQLFDRVARSLDLARDEFGKCSDGREELGAELIGPFEDRLRNDVLGRVGPFWPMIVTEPKHRQGFVRALRQSAEDAVSEHCLAVATSASSPDGSSDPVRDAKPMWPTAPGRIRWLLAGPTAAAVAPLADRIERQFGRRPTIVKGGDGRVTLLCEAEGIPLANVTREIIGNRTDYLETAKRVYTRQDIDWVS